MSKRLLHLILTWTIATVWVSNGLFCKILNWAPRHQQIVSVLLGFDHARLVTSMIGIAEVIMAIWILTLYKSKINALTQICVVGLMNTIEFLSVPELLLWGRFNALYALIFIGIVYYWEFVLHKELKDNHEIS